MTHFSSLSPEENRKREISHAKREIEEWRRFNANTKDPIQKLFAQNQINEHIKSVKNLELT